MSASAARLPESSIPGKEQSEHEILLSDIGIDAQIRGENGKSEVRGFVLRRRPKVPSLADKSRKYTHKSRNSLKK
jgi:hypothetical protein